MLHLALKLCESDISSHCFNEGEMRDLMHELVNRCLNEDIAMGF